MHSLFVTILSLLNHYSITTQSLFRHDSVDIPSLFCHWLSLFNNYLLLFNHYLLLFNHVCHYPDTICHYSTTTYLGSGKNNNLNFLIFFSDPGRSNLYGATRYFWNGGLQIGVTPTFFILGRSYTVYSIEGDRFGTKRDRKWVNKLAGARNERGQNARDC